MLTSHGRASRGSQREKMRIQGRPRPQAARVERRENISSLTYQAAFCHARNKTGIDLAFAPVSHKVMAAKLLASRAKVQRRRLPNCHSYDA